MQQLADLVGEGLGLLNGEVLYLFGVVLPFLLALCEIRIPQVLHSYVVFLFADQAELLLAFEQVEFFFKGFLVGLFGFLHAFLLVFHNLLGVFPPFLRTAGEVVVAEFFKFAVVVGGGDGGGVELELEVFDGGVHGVLAKILSYCDSYLQAFDQHVSVFVAADPAVGLVDCRVHHLCRRAPYCFLFRGDSNRNTLGDVASHLAGEQFRRRVDL